jgi:hypothetical protein
MIKIINFKKKTFKLSDEPGAEFCDDLSRH